MDQNLSQYAQIIGKEWKARSRELAEWALERLVNRKDVWGQYTTLTEKEKREANRGYKALTLPQKSMRGKDMVTLEKLDRHFGSLRRNHLIGLHATSENNTSKWMAIDIDLHDPESVVAEDAARRNFNAAIGWWEQLQSQGYAPLLLDSNGAGGFHIWVLFADPQPTPNVFAFAQRLTTDWQQHNLDQPPETFPKNAALSGNKLGAWLRLPGLHHTRDHFTKAWSGEAWLDEPWLEGNGAIDALLEALPGPPPPPASEDEIENLKLKRQKARADSGVSVSPGSFRSRKSASGKKPSVCIDLDGVLARYDGWKGRGKIGDPVDGAVEFTRSLAGFASIIIHTSRASDAAAAKDVAAWLDQFGFAWDEINTAAGKPVASAYIDDRAVVCRPQSEGTRAFQAAEEAVRKLCS